MAKVAKVAKRAKVARAVKGGNDLALVGRAVPEVNDLEAVGRVVPVDAVPVDVDLVVVDREGHVVVVTTASATSRRMNFPKKYFASTVRPRWSRVVVVSGLAPR